MTFKLTSNLVCILGILTILTGSIGFYYASFTGLVLKTKYFWRVRVKNTVVATN